MKESTALAAETSFQRCADNNRCGASERRFELVASLPDFLLTRYFALLLSRHSHEVTEGEVNSTTPKLPAFFVWRGDSITMKTTSFPKLSLLVLLAAFCPSLAHAHTGVSTTHDFLHGLAHPLTGIDHICAMIAVGLWAAQRGGRALWAVPLTFVTVMAVGGALGMAGLAIPFAEKGIVLSVLMLGVLIAASIRLPLIASTLIVALFAVFHGHAHGVEMSDTASGLVYGAGFVLATACLHLGGIGLGMLTQKVSAPYFVRIAGGAIAGCGMYLMLA